MSFILDALKRADRERRLERAPDLSAVYDEDNLPRSSMQPWVWLSASFLVGAIVVGLILWPEGPGPGQSPILKDKSVSQSVPVIKTKRTPSSPATPDCKPARPKEPSTRAPSFQPPREPTRGTIQLVKEVHTKKIATETPVKVSAKKESRQDAKIPDTKSVSTAGQASANLAGPVVSEEKRESVQPAPTVLPVAKDASVEPKTPVLSKEAEKKEVKGAVRIAEPPSTTVDEAKKQAYRKRLASVPLISEIPYEVREKLGKIQINVHSYSENPAERLVFINMKSLKVGDRIGEDGPVLKEITPDGVVIDYGEGQARLQVW